MDFEVILRKAEKRFGKDDTRLAADAWGPGWKTLIVTIMSAQSRDETTIPIADKLFENYPSVEDIAGAEYEDVLKIFSGLNYNKTKAKHVIMAAQKMLKDHEGKAPKTIEELLEIPGVGRKTANLVLTEVHHLPGICVDTHVHRISNVLGLVDTKTPKQTEMALRKIAPKEDWARINRLFVLWGKSVPGRDKKRLLRELEPEK